MSPLFILGVVDWDSGGGGGSGKMSSAASKIPTWLAFCFVINHGPRSFDSDRGPGAASCHYRRMTD